MANGYSDRLDQAGIDLTARLRIEQAPIHAPRPARALEWAANGDCYLVVGQSLEYKTGSNIPIHDCLHDFLQLASAGHHPERVLRFARIYGNLNICKHPHETAYFAAQCCNDCGPCADFYEAQEGHWSSHGNDMEQVSTCLECQSSAPREAIAQWERLARQARAALAIGACLRVDRQVTAELFQDFLPGGPPPIFSGLRRGLLLFVSQWLTHGRVEIALCEMGDDGGTRHAMRLLPHSVIGLLALQLGAALSSPTLACCVECNEPLLDRKQRPRAGSRILCENCHLANDRQRQRERYARQHPIQQRASAYRTGQIHAGPLGGD